MRSMSFLEHHPAVRWLAPVRPPSAVAAVTPYRRVSAEADPASLRAPPPSCSSTCSRSSVAGLSGTVVETADLGLPTLPGIGGEQRAAPT